MIKIKVSSEIEKIGVSCRVAKEVLNLVEENIRPEISTIELDRIAEEYIRKQGALPGFKGLYGFPATLCISIEDEVVHGIPQKRKLRSGDIVSIDVGVFKNKYFGDHARTFPVGEVDDDRIRLMMITKECLNKGIKAAKPGNRIGDIGFAIQTHAEMNKFSVVRELVGHGIGTELHEDPQIPNFGRSGNGPMIREGMCFAIEPMINMGDHQVYSKSNNWTVCTSDGKPSAHFEHTVVIEKNNARILTN